MGNAINGMAGRSPIAAMGSAQEAVPAAAPGGSTKLLYGTASQELTNMMNRLKQFPSTAQTLVSSRNPDVQ